jgi:uncharacterized membrane protein YqjE
MANADERPVERSIAEVLGNIVGNVQHIVRAEIRLAKAELREDAVRVKRGMSFLAIAGVIGLFALGFLFLAAVYALSMVVAPWLAALIVAVAIAVIAAALASAGLKSMKNLGLPRTAETIQENVQWLKTRAR